MGFRIIKVENNSSKFPLQVDSKGKVTGSVDTDNEAALKEMIKAL
jgi:hypothetical protein